MPLYDNSDERHRRLVELSEEAEMVAVAADIANFTTFQAQRRAVRDALEEASIAAEIDAIVLELLAPAAPTA